eukprot:GDKJ01004513.1.p3 GENE.GDKJ01004513.1~~GDKJ01004513.1.p3  ORF type:complete len:101 (-),score=2.09 GDKJ01004513.1:32-334(-)
MFGEGIEISERIIRNQQGFSSRTFHFFVDKYNSRCRFQGFVVVFRMVDKNNITRRNHMDLVHAIYRKIISTNIVATDDLSNFLECMCFGESQNYSFTRSI